MVLPAARVRHFPAAVGARQLLLMMFIVEDLHFATLPLLCHHPTSSRYGGALPPAVGAGAQPYTAGRPTPPQRLKNPMGRTVRDGRRNLCAAVSAKTALQAAAEAISETYLLTSRLREADMCVDF